MALFQKSVLNKYLKNSDDKQVLAAYQAFTTFIQNPTNIESTIQAVIDKTDKEIAQLVYALHGLISEKTKVVEIF